MVKTKITFAVQGEYIGLKNYGFRPVTNKFQRGKIGGFSKKSRSRLNAKIAMLNKNIIPVFVTLTYPDKFSNNFEDYKRDLDNFSKAFLYRFSEIVKGKRVNKAGFIWKLEFQSRGAAHFHLLVWGTDYDRLKEFVPETWFRIAGQGDKNHLLFHRGELGNNHCVEIIRSWKGVKSYASKYFSKNIEGSEVNGGRVWGLRGKVPVSKILEFTVDINTALEFRRSFRRWSGYKNKRFGFWSSSYNSIWLVWIFQKLEERVEENIPPNFYNGWWKSATFGIVEDGVY
jgi:hypothetical protein